MFFCHAHCCHVRINRGRRLLPPAACQCKLSQVVLTQYSLPKQVILDHRQEQCMHWCFELKPDRQRSGRPGSPAFAHTTAVSNRLTKDVQMTHHGGHRTVSSPAPPLGCLPPPCPVGGAVAWLPACALRPLSVPALPAHPWRMMYSRGATARSWEWHWAERGAGELGKLNLLAAVVA